MTFTEAETGNEMTVVYLNWNGPDGRETVDQFPANTREERAEVKRCVSEYRLAGMDVYRSQRCCREWNE